MLVVTKTVIRVISPDLEVIKRFFMLNSNEPEMSTAHENKLLENDDICCFQIPRCFIYCFNKCKMPTIVEI